MWKRCDLYAAWGRAQSSKSGAILSAYLRYIVFDVCLFCRMNNFDKYFHIWQERSVQSSFWSWDVWPNNLKPSSFHFLREISQHDVLCPAPHASLFSSSLRACVLHCGFVLCVSLGLCLEIVIVGRNLQKYFFFTASQSVASYMICSPNLQMNVTHMKFVRLRLGLRWRRWCYFHFTQFVQILSAAWQQF